MATTKSAFGTQIANDILKQALCPLVVQHLNYPSVFGLGVLDWHRRHPWKSRLNDWWGMIRHPIWRFRGWLHRDCDCAWED